MTLLPSLVSSALASTKLPLPKLNLDDCSSMSVAPIDFPTSDLDAKIVKRARLHQFSGVVLVKQGDQSLFKSAYGEANRSWNIANQTTTRFRLASISKMFTAVGILQLIDQGKLALETPVMDCLSLEETAISEEVTIAHLLTMTAGIADWFTESDSWEEDWAKLCRDHPIYNFRQNQDYLPLFIHTPAVAPVGQCYQYNNAAYILLGLVIETLSGLSYFDYVRRNIFAKAGMEQSDFLALDGIYANVAQGYVPITDGKGAIAAWKTNVYSTTPEAAADGGASSTVEDLARFSYALRTGALLSKAQTAAFLTPKVLDKVDSETGELWNYGYGNQFLLTPQNEVIRWGHTGEEDGVSCRFYHYLQQNVDVVILANQSWCAGELAWDIHSLLVE
ncbi:MAG: serine hydrolase domain-containing protein [Cyanobacteria bacterium P01_F01_bin.150]